VLRVTNDVISNRRSDIVTYSRTNHLPIHREPHKVTNKFSNLCITIDFTRRIVTTIVCTHAIANLYR
jgi:hypothetical protein